MTQLASSSHSQPIGESVLSPSAPIELPVTGGVAVATILLALVHVVAREEGGENAQADIAPVLRARKEARADR
eukprot:CAMPEP_0178593874 /NCGR_PEP_ID=MMETSP0697-20121206/30186_1 /TAXON_ID=265572 /ORGANISM="Extubocellulus spinifer, Strain CCMP396" /LENGTH=72 /DNA_ID=CAMNT_0020231093 /DNA_START=10 /DNA_END=228 /DNA_ORIENTATION=+